MGRTQATGRGRVPHHSVCRRAPQAEAGHPEGVRSGIRERRLGDCPAMDEAGAKVIAVSDSQGCVFNGNGLPTRRLIDYKRETGRVSGFPESSRCRWRH